MEMSNEARKAITEPCEGLALSAYEDPYVPGLWTVGYGHTARAGAPIPYKGMIITSAYADEILSLDLANEARGMTGLFEVPPLQREFDAFNDFVHNCGLGAFRSSTMLRKFNQGDKLGAAAQFPYWTKSGGVTAPGLVKRRAAERFWFLGQPLPRMEIFGEQQMTRAIDNPESWYVRVVNYLHTL